MKHAPVGKNGYGEMNWWEGVNEIHSILVMSQLGNRDGWLTSDGLNSSSLLSMYQIDNVLLRRTGVSVL